jgi:hypothetical protein
MMRTLTLFFLVVACLASSAWAQPAAVVRLALGTAAVVPTAGDKATVVDGLPLNVGDVIETGSDGYVHALFGDGSLLAVRPNSVVRIAGFSAKGDAADALWIELTGGALRAVTGWISKVRPSGYKVTTRTMALGVRGTDFELVHIPSGQAGPGESAGTHVLVHEGAVTLETQAGRIGVGPGLAAFATAAGESPRLHDGVPAFLRNRAGKTDAPVEEHARRINEHMAASLKERGLLRGGESVERHIERRAKERAAETRPPQRPAREERTRRPERPQRPERPERH